MARRGAISSAAQRPAGRCPLRRRRGHGLRRGARIGRARAAEWGERRGGWLGLCPGEGGGGGRRDNTGRRPHKGRGRGEMKQALPFFGQRGGWRGSLDSTDLLHLEYSSSSRLR
ncbi:hypothetical protein EJB05_06690, partial [Eragrostis curvula]